MQSPGGTRGQKGSGRPTAAVANHRHHALPRPRYGAGQVSGSSRRPPAAGGRGHFAAGGPNGFGTEKSSYAAHLMWSPGAKIKFKLAGTLQIFNLNLWRVR